MSLGDSYWLWQEQDEDGSWGVIAALVPELWAAGPVPLIFRDANMAAALGAVAKAHVAVSGRPLRLAKFALEEEQREPNAAGNGGR